MDTVLNGSSVKGFLALIEVHLFYLNHLIIIVFSITGVPDQKRECGGLFQKKMAIFKVKHKPAFLLQGLIHQSFINFVSVIPYKHKIGSIFFEMVSCIIIWKQ